MKKSFIIYTDTLAVLDTLTDEQAGQLFRAIKSYHETGESGLTGMFASLFTTFKSQFDRDAIKYKKRCDSNKINGLKGGRPKPNITEHNPMGYLVTQHNPIKPDNDSDNDNDNDKKNRGTRFALNELPEDWAEFCLKERPDLNPRTVFLGFADYWIASPKGVKLDWFATWRNWVRNQKQQQRLQHPKPQRAGVKTL